MLPQALRMPIAMLATVLLVAGGCLAAYAYAEHNPLAPGFTGCRLVRDTDSRIGCYSGRIESVVADRGTTAALKFIEAEAQQNKSLAGDCHLAWHPVGERRGAAAAASGKPLDSTSTSYGGMCSQGFVHGYTIGYAEASTSTGNAATGALAVCTSGVRTLDDNCLHSAGHVIARTSDWVQDQSVSECESLRREISSIPSVNKVDVAPMVQECKYGALMEITLRDMQEQASPQTNNCVGQHGEVLGECMRFLPTRVALLGGDFADAAASCYSSGGDRAAVRECAMSYAGGVEQQHQCGFLQAAHVGECEKMLEARLEQRQAEAQAEGKSAGQTRSKPEGQATGESAGSGHRHAPGTPDHDHDAGAVAEKR